MARRLRKRTARAAVTAGILALAAAGAVNVFIGSPTIPGGGGGVTCDSSVSTRTALVSALGDTANAGKTVCVTANITGSAITVTTDFATQARFIAQPADMTIDLPSVTFDAAHKLTIEGFEVPLDGFDFSSNGGSGDISIVKNYIHDYVGNAVHIPGGITASNVTITGNRVSCVAYPANGTPSDPTGYGFYSDATNTNLTVTYNTIHGCGNNADGMQLADVQTGNVSYNIIDNLHWNGVGTDPHADCLMLWGGSSSVTVQNNRMFNCPDYLNSPDGTDITVNNNLLVDMDNGNSCLDEHPNGSSGTIYPLRHTISNNTIWACVAGLLLNGGSGGRNGNVLSKNLIEGNDCPGTNSTFSSIDHNLFGQSNSCSFSGTNTYSFSPSWSQTSNSALSTYYIPTNLPGGYTDAGYTYVAAGYTAAP